MIVAFYFRVGPVNGPFELVIVAPQRYAIANIDQVEPDRRAASIDEDLEPCAIEHECDVCATRVLEPVADLQDADWLRQWEHVQHDAGALQRWWPYAQTAGLTHDDAIAVYEHAAQAELCPDCFDRHGTPEDWTTELLDRVYGPENGPARFYPPHP